jgi:hypothetical protein
MHIQIIVKNNLLRKEEKKKEDRKNSTDSALVPEQLLSWYPNCTLLCSPPNGTIGNVTLH